MGIFVGGRVSVLPAWIPSGCRADYAADLIKINLCTQFYGVRYISWFITIDQNKNNTKQHKQKQNSNINQHKTTNIKVININL